LRHPHQATAGESIEWPLAKAAQTGDRLSASRYNHLGSPLHALQILTEAIVQLPNPDLALGLM